MPKSSGNGSRMIAIVDTSVSMSFRRRAILAFWVVSAVVVVPAVVLFNTAYVMPLAVIFGVLTALLCGSVTSVLVAAWPVLRVFWHWATELVVFSAVVYGWTQLLYATTMLVSLLGVAVVVGVVVGIGPVRRWVKAWGWCLIVRHRLRGCFTAIIRPAGTLAAVNVPLILAARPTPAGERVWVWLRPGLALSDLEGRTDKVAVACWASEVRAVRVSASYAALLRIDIARRDPLIGLVSSPLPGRIPDGVPAWTPDVDWEALDLDLDLDLADAADPVTDPGPAERGRRERKPRQPRPNSAPDVNPDDAYI